MPAEVSARRIALHVGAVAAVADVELVVLGGGLGANGDLLLAPVRSLLAEWLPYPPRVEVSSLGEAAVLTGALAVGRLAGGYEKSAELDQAWSGKPGPSVDWRGRLQALDQTGYPPHRAEILGGIIFVADFDVESLFAKHSELYETDRIEAHDCSQPVVQIDLIFGHFNVEIVDDH